MSCKIGNGYTVQPGDILFDIAQRQLGDGNRWREIMKPDGTRFSESEVGSLQVGQVICIPGSFTPPPSNSIAQRVLDLTNLERSRAGVGPLRLNAQLNAAAQAHTDLMVRYNRLDHQLPGEPSLGDRISQAGYRWSGIAENIAQGQRTPEDVVASWMSSPPHRANLLAAGYQDLGVGYANGYWTQNFGKP